MAHTVATSAAPRLPQATARAWIAIPLALAWSALLPAWGQISPLYLEQLNSGLANEAISAIEIFSAADTVAAGNFKYDNAGSDDPEFSTYQFPLGHHFGATTNQWRPFLEGYLGYFRLHEEIAGLGPPIGRYEIQSLTATAGGGVEWQPLAWLTVTPRVLLAYSKVWQDYYRDVPPSDPTANLIVNWDADALTVLPGLAVEAHWQFARWRLRLNSRYTYLHTFALDTSSPLIELDQDSHVWRNEISARYDAPWQLFQLPLYFRGGFARHDLAGQIRIDGFVSHFYEARASVGVRLPQKIYHVNEIELNGGYYFQGPFSGYSIGLSFGF